MIALFLISLLFYHGKYYVEAGLRSKCVNLKCNCYERLQLVDCSASNLHQQPTITELRFEVRILSFRRNHIVFFNISAMLESLPSLIDSVDLREKPLNCSKFFEQRVPPSVIIHTNCIRPSRSAYFRITTTTAV
jgi:hypothetical protein